MKSRRRCHAFRGGRLNGDKLVLSYDVIKFNKRGDWSRVEDKDYRCEDRKKLPS